uniref:Cation-transporting P-type ATPase N-terminal domain-containing protein n=1 Tax=Panagrolaimus sp. PS1159 TaxID=55785 RepID=A0AC35FP33_9BILA
MDSSYKSRQKDDSIIVKMEEQISLDELKALMTFQKNEGKEMIDKKYGGIEELCKKLDTNSKNGITNTEEELNQRRKIYGSNEIPPPPMKSFFILMWEAIKNFTLIILLISALISLGLSFYPIDGHEDDNSGWIEGAAILISVVVVVLVTAINDYTKERQFRDCAVFADTFFCGNLRSTKIFLKNAPKTRRKRLQKMLAFFT